MSNNPDSNDKRAEFAAAAQEYYKNKRANYDRAFYEAFGEPPDLVFREPEEDSLFTGEMADRSKESGTGHQTADQGAGSGLTQGTQSSGSGAKATAEDHKAMPGPVMAEKMPPAASKEELRKRTEELNK